MKKTFDEAKESFETNFKLENKLTRGSCDRNRVGRAFVSMIDADEKAAEAYFNNEFKVLPFIESMKIETACLAKAFQHCISHEKWDFVKLLQKYISAKGFTIGLILRDPRWSDSYSICSTKSNALDTKFKKTYQILEGVKVK